MDSYMNVRTDQETFGSYHPNDIKEDISNFFNDDGEPVHSDNHWGLMIYNPNAAMAQYMGQLQEPGNLVPGFQNAGEKGNQANQNAPVPSQGVGFNPNEFNKQLMKTLQSSGYSRQNAPTTIKENGAAFGFNPDTVNKELMASMLNHADQPQHMAAVNHNSPSHSNNHNANTGYGYNADQVNAGLYSSMNYNPNSVNSATFNMPSFSGSGSGMFADSGTSSVAGGTSSSSNNGTAPAMSNAGTQTQNTAGGIKTPFPQANSAMAGGSGTGGMGSYNPFSVAQSGSGLAGQQTGGNIVPAPRLSETGLPSQRVSQSGLPPGIPAGMKLTQTEAEKPTANGIGGLGI